MSKILRLSIGLVLFCAGVSCKKNCQDPTNPKCENYDSCYGKLLPSAKFIMETGGMFEWQNGEMVRIYYPDSVFKGYNIRFRSLLTDSKTYIHTWYVGNEIFTNVTQTPPRSFGNFARPQKITIIHVIEYTPNLNCFPLDKGKDSVAQSFDLVASLNEFQTYGVFRGALDGSLDSFNIEIESIDINNQPAGFNTHHDTRFVNFHNYDDTLKCIQSASWLCTYLYNHNGVFQSQIAGSFKVLKDNTFLMQYKANNDIILKGDTALHFFRGRKIK